MLLFTESEKSIFVPATLDRAQILDLPQILLLSQSLILRVACMRMYVRMASRLSMHAAAVAAALASQKSALGDATPRHQVLRRQCAQGAAARGGRGGGSECGMVLQSSSISGISELARLLYWPLGA